MFSRLTTYIFTILLATGAILSSGVTYGATQKSVITVQVYYDKNKDGTKQEGEPWLPDITVRFEYSGEDGMFTGTKDALRPQNDDDDYTKKTDKNGKVVINPGLGVVYSSIDPDDFTFHPEETRHLTRVNYAGKIDEWIVGVVPLIDPEAQKKKEAEAKKAEEEKKKAEEAAKKKAEEDKKKEAEAKKKKEAEAKKAEENKKKEQEAAAKKKAEEEKKKAEEAKKKAQEEKKELNSAGPTESKQCVEVYYKKCTTGGKMSGFLAYANNLACEEIIKKKNNCEEYKCQRDISKAEVVGIGLKMARVNIPDNYSCKNRFIDAGSSMPSWVCRAAELGLENGIAQAKDTDKKFNPNQKLPRYAAYAHLMRSVCMPVEPAKNIQSFDPALKYDEWRQRVIRTAQKHQLTKKSDADFNPDRPIYRQELFIIASKLLDWAQETGGCHKKNICE